MRLQSYVTTDRVSASVAFLAAGIAVWQTMEAKKAARESLKAALASERLSACLVMNQGIVNVRMSAMWMDAFTPPYSQNPRFLSIMSEMHFLGESAIEFEVMTPSEGASELSDAIWEIRIATKDMVADGGDYIGQQEFREKLELISEMQNKICNEMVAPEGGF